MTTLRTTTATALAALLLAPLAATAQDEPAAGAAEPAADAAPAADDAAAAPAAPIPEMQAVLDKLAELGAPPIGTVDVEAQRAAPTPADAVMAIMEEEGIAPDPALEAILTRDITYPGASEAELPARVYTPPGEGPFPLIVYYHGGGWVIAGIDVYDSSARALAAGAEAVVLSVGYRQGPEDPFPAAHEDANAAYAWAVENSGELNADSERLAVAGESAGGNLAINAAIAARDGELTQPDAMLLVYPLINNDLTLPSYVTYGDSPPLTRVAVEWFVEHAFTDPSETADPRVNVLDRPDLAGLPPATIINAEIDVLQSEGVLLAEVLTAAGVATTQTTYPGVTHEFFGMGAVVPPARDAVAEAAAALRAAFAQEG